MKFDSPEHAVLNHFISMFVSAYKIVFIDGLECVTLKELAVKGDFIKGYSDFFTYTSNPRLCARDSNND